MATKVPTHTDDGVVTDKIHDLKKKANEAQECFVDYLKTNNIGNAILRHVAGRLFGMHGHDPLNCQSPESHSYYTFLVNSFYAMGHSAIDSGVDSLNKGIYVTSKDQLSDYIKTQITNKAQYVLFKRFSHMCFSLYGGTADIKASSISNNIAFLQLLFFIDNVVEESYCNVKD